MKSFAKRDSLLKKREAALKKNLKEKKKIIYTQNKKMPVLSDKWIEKNSKNKGDD